MENLNDLIWTDEDVNESDDASTQGSEMYKVCMIAFCDSIVRSGGGTTPSGGAVGGFACGGPKYSHTGPC